MAASVIVAKVLTKDSEAIFFWTFIQSIFIILSIISIDSYLFLTSFISGSSRDKFESVFELRSIGFGIYHVEGAILFVFLSYLRSFVSDKNNKNYNTAKYYSLLSITMSRSSLLILGLIMLVKNPIWLLIFSLFAFAITPFIDIDDGVLYWAMELLINFNNNGAFSTASTDANVEMLVFPKFENLLFGEGKFFSEEGIFYMSTDIGISRLLFFGGIPYLLLFILMNLILINKIQYSSIKIIMFILFILLNFKGIFCGAFYFLVILILQDKVFDWKKS
jgi:hypothetical protein